MARGRKEKEIVQIVENDENSTRLIPSNRKQIEMSGVDASEPVYVRRTVRNGEKEIVLELANDKDELMEEE